MTGYTILMAKKLERLYEDFELLIDCFRNKDERCFSILPSQNSQKTSKASNIPSKNIKRKQPTGSECSIKISEKEKDPDNKLTDQQKPVSFQEDNCEFDPDDFVEESDSSHEDSSSETDENHGSKQFLHSHLPLNRNGKGPRGQNCICSKKNKTKWIVHKVYKGEKHIQLCDPTSNNMDKLRCYRIIVEPDINFKSRISTEIRHHGRTYEFDGYSLLSHYSLRKIPECSFIMFKRVYTIRFLEESVPKDFCIKDLDLFHELVFEKYFEISDWNIKGEKDGCQIFHILPRFVTRSDRYSISKQSSKDAKSYRKKLLPMSYVLEHLLHCHRPLVKHEQLKKSASEWREKGERLKESLVSFPERKPACIRVDGLSLQRGCATTGVYPDVVHYTDGEPNEHEATKRMYEQLKRRRENLRYIIDDCVLPDKMQLRRLREIEQKLEEMKQQRKKRIHDRLHISSQGCYETGLKTDVFQHAIPVYVAVDHIRCHKSFEMLEKNINYKFRDKLLLEKALRHISLPKRLPKSSHVVFSSFNCGFSKNSFGEGVTSGNYRRKRGLGNLSEMMLKLPETEVRPSTVCHNESLEFLGDSILEMITTSRLFFLFSTKTEGELSRFRSLLVGNAHLADVAKRIELEDFVLLGHCDFSEGKLNHILANCVEALTAAVYLDGGYEKAEKLLQFLHFEEEVFRKTWSQLPRHMLQERAPEGDRHLIERSPRLQQLLKLEEQLGLTFNHISLLARAFTCFTDQDNALTGGSNQRLEFLGDTILKYIVSDYLYQHFPDHQEGHLTLLRTSLVKAKTQATVFKELGLDKFIEYAEQSKAVALKIFANVFEAFIAAVFVDKGIEYCKKICEVTLFRKLPANIFSQSWMDPKSKLQHCCTYIRSDENKSENPIYKILEVSKPNPHRTYTAAVYFKNEQIGVGTGKKIRDAEAAAALDALESNRFEVQDKQKRDVYQRYGPKRFKCE